MPMYILGAGAAGVIILGVLFAYWKSFLQRTGSTDEAARPGTTGWVAQIVVTMVVLGAFGWGCMTAYDQLNPAFAAQPAEENPAQAEYRKLVEDFQPVDDSVMEQKSAAQERKRLDEPHTDALSDFDKAMQREANKIKERNDLD